MPRTPVLTLPPPRPSVMTSLEFFNMLKWIDGTPLGPRIQPYRQRLFTDALDARDEMGRLLFNLILYGRSKKNDKTTDLVLMELYAVLTPTPAGAQCYLIANDEGQASDDLSLAKKLIDVNPALREFLVVKKDIIERKDHRGFIEVLPAGDTRGAHGKTYRLCGFDEIHGYKNWDILEAMQLDPTRPDAQMVLTSYASLYHVPGAPLFDLSKIGREGRDPRMLFSWYAADFTTDPDFANLDPESRANPSRGAWPDQGYLDQQRLRLPAHMFRRLHLNLPGLPTGSAYTAEMIMDSVARGITGRSPQPDLAYCAFVDMSGGSNDDACLGVAHLDADGRAILDCVINQGPPPPFDPRRAVERFVRVLREYNVSSVCGDKYAGETFRADFERHGVRYDVCELTRSQLYERLEPRLNAREIVLLDVPVLEQQFLGLIWRGNKIDHPANEHDDFSNAATGALLLAHEPAPVDTQPTPEEMAQLREINRYLGGGFIGEYAIPDEPAPFRYFAP